MSGCIGPHHAKAQPPNLKQETVCASLSDTAAGSRSLQVSNRSLQRGSNRHPGNSQAGLGEPPAITRRFVFRFASSAPPPGGGKHPNTPPLSGCPRHATTPPARPLPPPLP